MRRQDKLMFVLYAAAFVMGFSMLTNPYGGREAWLGGFQMVFIAIFTVLRVALIRKHR